MWHFRAHAATIVAILGALCGAASGWCDQGVSLLARSPIIAIGHSVTLQSSVLGEDRQLLISLPADYETADQPAAVIYLLDGRAHFKLVAATVELLTRNARMPRSIVVGIANTDRNRDFTSIATDGARTGGASRFLEFLETEVIPFVEGNFRTAPHRTLIGHSLGGLLVMNALADRPELFQAAVAISPAVTNDQRVGKGSASISDRLATTLKNRKELAFALFITMSDGEDGRWVTDFEAVEEVLETSVPDGFSWAYRRIEGEDHGTTVLPSVFQGLRFINADWDTSGLVREGSLEELVARFASLSSRLGHDITPPEVMVNLLGYRLLGEDRVDEAIEAFELNVTLYPESANAYDSLGEALEHDGSLPGALRSYRAAVRRAEASNDPLLPVFRTNLRRVETRMGGGSDSQRLFEPISAGERPLDPDRGVE